MKQNKTNPIFLKKQFKIYKNQYLENLNSDLEPTIEQQMII